MHIWLVEFKAILRKAYFVLSFQIIFFLQLENETILAYSVSFRDKSWYTRCPFQLDLWDNPSISGVFAGQVLIHWVSFLPLFTLQSFTWEIGMMRSSVDILVQLLRIVHNRGHGYDHSFDTLERLCTFTTRVSQPILSLTFLKWKGKVKMKTRHLGTSPLFVRQTHTRHSSVENCRNQVPRT